MGLVRLAPSQVVASAVAALGHDKTIADLSTPEVLAAAVRRAASFLCPATPRALTRAVSDTRIGLVEAADSVTDSIRAMVGSVAAYGDLVEVPVTDDDGGPSRRTLFLAQPAYVRISEATCVLLGVPADGVALLDDALTERVEHDGHIRRLEFGDNEDPSSILAAAGLREYSEAQWLEHPPAEEAGAHVADYVLRLSRSGPSGSIEGFQILDGSQPVTYYRGRWRIPTKKDSGSFVARRPLQFGADAWCFVQLEGGEVVRLFDLPVHNRMNRGCDEAWRLQAAMDSVRGASQVVRSTDTPLPGRRLLHLLSPIPSWAQRRLDIVGRPVERQRGSLVSYSVDERQIDKELAFLQETMWLTIDAEGGPA